MKYLIEQRTKDWQQIEKELANKRLILMNERKEIDKKVDELDQKMKEEEQQKNKNFAKSKTNFFKEKETLLGRKITNMIKVQDLLREEKDLWNSQKQMFTGAIQTSKQAIKSLDNQNQEILNASKDLNPETFKQVEAENYRLVLDSNRLSQQNKFLNKKFEILALEQKNLMKKLKDKQAEKESENER